MFCIYGILCFKRTKSLSNSYYPALASSPPVHQVPVDQVLAFYLLVYADWNPICTVSNSHLFCRPEEDYRASNS